MGIITAGIPEEATLELSRLNNSTVFVETGTFQGNTARWASTHFKYVHTIERAENLYSLHSKELSKIKGVAPYLGDSRSILPKVLKDIGDQPSVFWLDGHWSGSETAGENDECPLLGELACLSSRFDDIILIDDARLFLCAPPLPHDPSQWPTIPEIIFALPASGERHFIQIVDDVIFVIPNKSELRSYLVDYARNRSTLFWRKFTKYQIRNFPLISRLKGVFKNSSVE